MAQNSVAPLNKRPHAVPVPVPAAGIGDRLAEVEASRAALRVQQTELETAFLESPAASWREVAEKARYLLTLYAASSAARGPRHQKLIADVLGDLKRLSKGSDADEAV